VRRGLAGPAQAAQVVLTTVWAAPRAHVELIWPALRESSGATAANFVDVGPRPRRPLRSLAVPDRVCSPPHRSLVDKRPPGSPRPKGCRRRPTPLSPRPCTRMDGDPVPRARRRFPSCLSLLALAQRNAPCGRYRARYRPIDIRTAAGSTSARSCTIWSKVLLTPRSWRRAVGTPLSMPLPCWAASLGCGICDPCGHRSRFEVAPSRACGCVGLGLSAFLGGRDDSRGPASILRAGSGRVV